ncbi:hypothetical protein FB451DRAFT_1563949 [Mycena latifolia]|nr:hypothetical protein FB451DRAFT_1563949 [Mycena latifolia]
MENKPGNHLPLDLERAIFELSALSRPAAIPALMRVAWRAKAWVEPLLYRVICVSDSPLTNGLPHFTLDILLAAMHRKPATFFQHSVRHLYLEDRDAAQLCAILDACTGVTDLFAQVPDIASAAPVLAALPLRRLTVHIGGLDLTDALFRQITHLTVLDAAGWDSAGLADIPHLTHFAYASPAFPSASWPVRTLLACPHLACCVLFTPLGLNGAAWLPADARFVWMCRPSLRAEWQRGAHTGDDYWTRAEALIATRRTSFSEAVRGRYSQRSLIS